MTALVADGSLAGSAMTRRAVLLGGLAALALATCGRQKPPAKAPGGSVPSPRKPGETGGGHAPLPQRRIWREALPNRGR